ncbi:MAG: hypothetical protein Q9202_004281 [Teloschistes flavicans]
MDSIEEAGGEYDEGAREIVELSTPKIQDPAIQDPLDYDGVFDLNQQSLQYLRDHYGNRTTPDFITFSRVEYQKRLFVAKDGPKTGFLDQGEYVGTITTKRWNRKHRFRTFFLNDRQLIVKYMGTWCVWLGVSQGFANRTLRDYILHNRVSSIAPADVRESSVEGYEAHGGIMSDVHATDRAEPSPMSSIATQTPFLGVSLLSNTTNYNIARIISDDWHYYGDTRPPFVQDREGMPVHKLKARIFDQLGDEYDDEFELRSQVWNSKASYWTVCVQEHKYIIKVVPMDRGHPNLLKLWLGHKQDFLLNPIGYLTSPNVLSSTGIQSIPKTRHDPMKVIGPIKRQYHTQQIQYVDTEVDDDAAEGELTATPIDTIPFHEISRFHAWLDELKEKFGRQIPPFVQEKGSLAVDQAVEVVEATFSGRYPDPARTSVSKCSVMVRSWNRNYVYFTYDLLAKRRIVVPFMVGSGCTAYHRWRSTEEGFDSVPLAFDIDEEDSATAAASDGSLGTHRPG